MLRDQGEKTKRIIEDTKPASVGDLVLSTHSALQNLIGSLEDQPKLRDRAKHIDALFRELTFGEPYDMQYAEEPETIEEFPSLGTIGGFGVASGVIQVSGALPNPQPLPPLGVPLPPILTPAPIEEPEDIEFEEERAQVDSSRRPFKPKWWQTIVEDENG